MINHIKKLRTELNITQDELAAMCDVTRQTINAIENNKYNPTLTLAFSLSKALKTTVDSLFVAEG